MHQNSFNSRCLGLLADLKTYLTVSPLLPDEDVVKLTFVSAGTILSSVSGLRQDRRSFCMKPNKLQFLSASLELVV